LEREARKNLIEGGSWGPATVVEGDHVNQSSTTAGDWRSYRLPLRTTSS
jgi:hypothetical protein